MRVVASHIDLAASNKVVRTATEKVKGRVWLGDEGQADTVAVSDQARTIAHGPSQLLTTAAKVSPQGTSAKSKELDEVSDDELLSDPQGVRWLIMRQLLEAMTGHEIKVIHAKDLKVSEEDQQALADLLTKAQTQGNAQPAAGAQRVGWGIELDIERQQVDTKTSSFAAQGTILTADGRTIAFEATFVEQSSTVSVEKLSLRAGDAKLKDPLVLLYSGNQAQLAESAAAFDLNADGNLEKLPGVTNGAYLVSDKNRNGKVDDGSELVGALSGDGFADLRSMDTDNNGFVDGGDTAFDTLYAWQPSAEGPGTLRALAKTGVGALYTSNVATPADLTASSGALQGRVRTTGVYVSEDGNVRPLEQIDVKA